MRRRASGDRRDENSHVALPRQARCIPEPCVSSGHALSLEETHECLFVLDDRVGQAFPDVPLRG
jgi:hypothetical protein